jgi:hypothetical protein
MWQILGYNKSNQAAFRIHCEIQNITQTISSS